MIAGSEKAKKSLRKRLVVDVAGWQKRGSTHFGLTAPGPIQYFDLNVGSEGVIDKFVDSKEIYRAKEPYRFYAASGEENWVATWERYKRDYLAALADPAIKSLVIDKHSEAYELLRLARLGKLTQVPPNRYTPVNAEMSYMIEKGVDSGKNVVFVHTMGDEYIGTINQKTQAEVSVRTGKSKRNVFKEMPGLAQVSIEMLRNDDEPVEEMFGLRIVDCRLNPGANKTELWGAMCNFSFLAVTVMPESNLTDWM